MLDHVDDLYYANEVIARCFYSKKDLYLHHRHVHVCWTLPASGTPRVRQIGFSPRFYVIIHSVISSDSDYSHITMYNIYFWLADLFCMALAEHYIINIIQHIHKWRYNAIRYAFSPRRPTLIIPNPACSQP